MKTMNMNDHFMAKAIEESVWENISEELNWNEQLLHKFRDKVDWEKISNNSNIMWTSSMLEKFEGWIDWDALSSSYYHKGNIFTPANLEKFKSRWNWTDLSRNDVGFTIEIIDRFVDKWDWEALIDNRDMEDLFNEGFLEKYKQYIPAAELQSSVLWRKLVEVREKEIIAEILSE